MDKFRKIITCFLAGSIAAAMLLLLPQTLLTSYAAAAKISFSDPSAQVGNEVSVTMKVASGNGEMLGSANIMLSYDAALLQFVSGDHAQGGAGSVKVTGLDTTNQKEWKYTLKFKTLQAGTAAVKVSTQEVYDVNEKAVTIDQIGSSSVKITSSAKSSADASLTALKISPGVLTPEFSAKVTDYTTVVGEDVDKIAVSAPTSDANAKVVISGNEQLKMGDNTVTCKVTAQDGTTVKTYSIKVTKQSGKTPTAAAESAGTSASLKVSLNGADYEIASTFDKSLLPDGFESAQYTYKGQSVAAGKNAKANLVLMFLVGNGGSGDFYFYDEKTDSWSPYAAITVSAKSMTVVPLDAGTVIPDGFTESALDLNGKKVRGWVRTGDTEQKYCLFYGMNKDGEKSFYRYDMKEKTIQRYFADDAAAAAAAAPADQNAGTQYSDLMKKYDRRGIFLVVLLAALIASLIGLFVVLSRLAGIRATLRSARPSRRGSEGGADDSGTEENTRNGKAQQAEDTAPEAEPVPKDEQDSYERDLPVEDLDLQELDLDAPAAADAVKTAEAEDAPAALRSADATGTAGPEPEPEPEPEDAAEVPEADTELPVKDAETGKPAGDDRKQDDGFEDVQL